MIQTRSSGYHLLFLWTVCLVAAMGGLLFGYDWVVIGGAKPFYEPFFGIANGSWWQGLTMSSALVGCLVGALAAGALSDRYGRKRLLILAGFMFTLSAVGTALAWNLTSFNTFRVIGGIGIGIASNLSPMYIAEVSPAAVRGKFVSINQLTIVIGILAAQLVNMSIARPVPSAGQVRELVAPGTDSATAQDRAAAARVVVESAGIARVRQAFPDLQPRQLSTDSQNAEKEREDSRLLYTYIMGTWNGRYGWRWMFGAETVPAFAFFLLMFFVPESPRWLVKNGQADRAQQILARVAGAEHAGSEVTSIQKTLGDDEIGQVHFTDLLEPRLLRIIALGVFLVVFQQWCGINVIFNYAQEVFRAAGYQVNDILLNIVITGVVNLVFTFVAIYTVDRFGRKRLMLIGAGGLALIYAALGTGFWLHSHGPHMLLLVVAAIACYAMSLAPVTWVLVSEIFPNRIRGAAMSVAVFFLWAACTALTTSFPILNQHLGAHGTFWLYGGICVLGFFVIAIKLPETKGKSLEQIEHELIGPPIQP